jgi:hypothetical protein
MARELRRRAHVRLENLAGGAEKGGMKGKS